MSKASRPRKVTIYIDGKPHTGWGSISIKPITHVMAERAMDERIGLAYFTRAVENARARRERGE